MAPIVAMTTTPAVTACAKREGMVPSCRYYDAIVSRPAVGLTREIYEERHHDRRRRAALHCGLECPLAHRSKSVCIHGRVETFHDSDVADGAVSPHDGHHTDLARDG